MKLEERRLRRRGQRQARRSARSLSEAVAGDHRVLVFSQFVEMLQLIKKALDRTA
jgi:SNF2 family DNA or RNA helicase